MQRKDELLNSTAKCTLTQVLLWMLLPRFRCV